MCYTLTEMLVALDPSLLIMTTARTRQFSRNKFARDNLHIGLLNEAMTLIAFSRRKGPT